MTDIVERLRAKAYQHPASTIYDEAADEIERLRAELAEAESKLARCDGYIERLLLEEKK